MNEFRRMMQRVLKNNRQEQWVSVTLVLLFAGLLFSRAVLSIASVAMIVPFLFAYRSPQIKRITVAAIGLVLIPVIISGIWSEDTHTWWNSISVKIPFLTMMLGLSVTTLSQKRWLQITWFYILFIMAGCAWSLQQYMSDPSFIQAGYLKAKVMPTPADNDYVRFSWMVAIAVFLGMKCLFVRGQKKTNLLLSCLLVFLIFYLHILASKTGLLCLYTGGMMYFLHLIFIQKKWKAASGMLVLMLAIAATAYSILPTLRNRVQYLRYDFSTYSQGHFTPGYNDGARWLSIRAGYGITQQHPLTGVGFGDIRTAINEWHQINQPDSFTYERFLPANEWLVYGAGSGWPGMILFTTGLGLLLYITTSKNIGSIILSAIAIIPFITDDSLEGQYGVVMLAFIVFFGQRNISNPPITA